MMKYTIYLITIIAIFSCNSNQKNTSDENRNLENKSVNEYEGVWGLTNYLDTIVANKQLAKYRIQSPTWSAILLEFKNDSLKAYGSISNKKFLVNTKKDTLTTITSNVTGEKWWLIKNNNNLKLVQYSDSKRKDTTTYIYRKREDLNSWTRQNVDFSKIGNNVTKYFNRNIFAGNYINGTQEVIFSSNGQLSGINGFNTFEVRNYFGTLHPHKNLDVVTLKNEDNNRFKQYNWVFKNDTLTLTDFVREKVMYNGETYDGDDLVLGQESITLKNTKHNNTYK